LLEAKSRDDIAKTASLLNFISLEETAPVKVDVEDPEG
jgi:hypothetical protein